MAQKLSEGLKTNRIEALSDGIFAIAMTILVLSFETILERPEDISENFLSDKIFGLWPDLLHYVVSFLILGAFWLQHHRQFHHIKRVDAKLIFINIIWLMMIAVIPFSTVLVGDYGHLYFAAFLFELNLFAAGLLSFAQWAYVSANRGFLEENTGEDVIAFFKRRSLIIPAVSVLAMLVSLLDPRIGTLCYFIVPAAVFAGKIRHE